MEAHHKGDKLDRKEVIQGVRSGIQLVGNANAHLSHLRRERVVSDFNKSLLPFVGDNSNFKDAAPLLFGMEFAKKGKDPLYLKTRSESLHFSWSPYLGNRGLQPQIRKRRSPKILLQQGEAVPRRERPIPHTEEDSNLVRLYDFAKKKFIRMCW